MATGGFYAGASPMAFARGGRVPGSYHYTAPHSGVFYPDTQPDPPPEDDPLTTPDLIEPVVGWRSWVLKANGDLMSANSHVAWRPGPNEAVCDSPWGIGWDHPAPQERCDCGLHVMYDPDDADERGEVLGLVKARGTIVLHPAGLRSQWAEIALLVVPGSLKDDPRVKRMREHYKVPCVSSVEEARYRAEEHGRAVPEKMRPEAEEQPDDGGYAQMVRATMMSATASRAYQKVLERERRAREQPSPPRLKESVRVMSAAAVLFATWAVLSFAVEPGVVWIIGGELGACVVTYPLAPKLWSLWLRVKCGWDRPNRHTNSLRYPHTAATFRPPGIGRGDPCPDCGWKLR